MAFCVFAPNSNIYDITPVENIFIEEFMRHAPGDAVKVYLYGLKLCYHHGEVESLEEFAHSLGMSLSAVAESFAYWENTGLVVRTGETPLRFAFYNVKNRLFDGPVISPLYQDEGFSISVQSLFAPRALKAEDLNRLYNCVDIFGLEREAVLLLIRFLIDEEEKKQAGKRPTAAKVEQTARMWAEKGIKTLKDAQAYLAVFNPLYEYLQKLLSYLGIKRTPSMPEYELYKKWTQEWNFTSEAVIAASEELTKIREPNMAYLDSVLQSCLKRGLTTETKISRYLKQKSLVRTLILEVRRELGIAGQVSPRDEEVYALWTGQWLFPHESVLLAAKMAAISLPKVLDSITQVLESWRAQGVSDPVSAKKFLDQIEVMNSELRSVFLRAGILKKPLEADRVRYQHWLDAGHRPEMIFLAAEYSSAAKNPLQYMDKLLSIWNNMGIRSVSKARAEHDRRFQMQFPQTNGSMRPSSLDYQQRDHSNTDFSKYLVDLSKYDIG
jgi:DNA replication protein DnaD